MGQLLNEYAANDEIVADLPERTYGKSEDVQILIENALRRCRPLTVKELVKFAGRERGSLVRQLHMMLAEKRIVLMIESHREGHERLLVTHPDAVSFRPGEDPPEKVFAEESKQAKARAARIAQLEEELQRLKAGATVPPNSRPSMRVAGFQSVPPPPLESTPTAVRRRTAKRARAS